MFKSVKHESKRAVFSLDFSFWMMNGFYHIFEVFNLELFWKAWHVKEKGKVLQAFFNQKILTEKSFFRNHHSHRNSLKCYEWPLKFAKVDCDLNCRLLIYHSLYYEEHHHASVIIILMLLYTKKSKLLLHLHSQHSYLLVPWLGPSLVSRGVAIAASRN